MYRELVGLSAEVWRLQLRGDFGYVATLAANQSHHQRSAGREFMSVALCVALTSPS